jgi:CopG family transcriptional regulator, nickel-responsive regulator
MRPRRKGGARGARAAGDGVVRFTVSLPASLMRTLDRLQSARRYSNRSEFVRDLCRAELVKKEWQAQRGETVGVLVLVYDHDTRALTDKLTNIQHDSHGMISSALHVHLDQHTCLEVIPLRGGAQAIQRVANQLLSIKGVRYGQLVPATTGKSLT